MAERLSKTELETFADSYATEVFTPLYKNDLFMLDRLEKCGNTNAYYALLWELVDKWTVPDEEQKLIEADIQKYAPKDCDDGASQQ